MRRFALLLAFAISLISGQSDTLQVVALEDVAIQEDSPTFNFGGASTFVSGALGSNAKNELRRALFHFDLSAIPPGSRVTSAQVRLTITKTPLGPVGSVFDLRKVQKPWRESEATWRFRLNGVEWINPGATNGEDIAATASSSTPVGVATGMITFASTAALVGDVQSWIDDSTSNSGWLLISESENIGKTARHFASREATSNRPLLTLDYVLPPTSPRIDTIERQPNRIILGFDIPPSTLTTLERNGELTSPNWVSLTNFSNKFGPAQKVEVVDRTTNTAGFYRLRQELIR
jgi:hypothetical protein